MTHFCHETCLHRLRVAACAIALAHAVGRARPVGRALRLKGTQTTFVKLRVFVPWWHFHSCLSMEAGLTRTVRIITKIMDTKANNSQSRKATRNDMNERAI